MLGYWKPSCPMLGYWFGSFTLTEKGNAMKRVNKKQVRMLVEHAKGVERLAGWLGVTTQTIERWLDGTTKRWKPASQKRVKQLAEECLTQTSNVTSSTGSPLRRLFRRLQSTGASQEVLGTVALFILEEEDRA